MNGPSMMAAVYRGPKDIRLEKRRIPQAGPGGALVRVMSASICGTDLRIYRGLHPHYPPGTVRIPGHEVVGLLEELPSKVEGLQVGEGVFVAPNIGCGRCRACVSGRPNLCPSLTAIGVTIDGGFAEYLQVPEAGVSQGNLIPLDEQADLSVAALIEPLACVLRGQDAVDVHAGDTVLVMGAGPIGMMHTMVAKQRGARRVIVSEVVPERLSQAERLGADRAINPQLESLRTAVLDETDGEGAEVVIVAASIAELQAMAPELAAIGGRINYFGGLPTAQSVHRLDTNLVHYRELKITGTTGCSTHDCRRAAAMAAKAEVDLAGLVGGRYPLAEVGKAIEAAQDRRALKVFLEPSI